MMESQAEVLEGLVVTLDSELEKDMEAPPSDCRAADKKLTRILAMTDGIQARTVAARNWKKMIMKRLDQIMDIIDDRWEEAKDYRRIKDKRADMRMREVSNQVKLAKDSELAKFIGH